MILWPFFPNWTSPYRETYDYLTEINVSESGKEQRRSWRIAARRTVEYKALMTPARFRSFRRTLRRQGETIVFPDEVRRHRSSVAALAGSMAVTFPTPLPAWLAAGRQVVFELRQTRERALRTVESVEDGVVTFTEEADRLWPASTRVMPALVGTLPNRTDGSVITDQVATAPVVLEVEPGTEIETPGFPVTTFRNLEVLTHRPNWTRPVDLQSVVGRQWLDFDMGVRQGSIPIEYVTETYQANHLIQTPEALDQTLGLFQRAQGRRGEFYMPTWLADITLLSTTAAGASLFTVAGHDFYDSHHDDTVYRAFCVRMADDTLQFFRIAAMSKSLTGTPRTLVTVTAPAAADVNPASVKTISWMPVCRFVSDSLSVGWTTDTVAEIMLNLQTLEDLT